MSADSITYRAPLLAGRVSRPLTATGRRLRARPELLGVMGIAAILDFWGLSLNGWANTYYSAAVRSMTTSWHAFLFASLDQTGLMTVDKPPLSLWIQALSARVFGFHPLSVLIPQAVMGVAATGLIYDLTRRRFGRAAGFAAGLALAITPIAVAMSRHNNPDELLVLCCVAALWCALRALDTGATKWLVLTGVFVGLGFEAKMGVALMVVPGITLAWLWIRPSAARRWTTAIGQLLAGGGALAVVGLAWPVLVTLTPASDRPWISGTSDNSVWSLIVSYNGVGRIAGQSGAPGAVGGGGGGGPFGGAAGVFRLLQSGLGDQAGWLLGFAIVAGVALLVLTRLRRSDPRTGWLIVVGGAFLTTAVVFSFSSGIFHPYYVSFLAPFTAALIGAGVGEARSGARSARIVGPLAIAGGAFTELVVLGTLGGGLSWAKPLVIGVGAVGAGALALALAPRIRWAVLTVALGALFAAPATWAAETLGHVTSGTFPAGGPASASADGVGGFGGPGAGARLRGFRLGGGPAAGAGPGGGFPGAGAGAGAGFSGAGSGGFPGGAGGAGFAGGGGGGGGIFGGNSAELNAAIRYAEAHGGGSIGVASQSSAAAAILATDADVAGLGGFSGRESSVTTTWIAMEVRSGRLRWVIDDGNQGVRGPGDSRPGSRAAMNVVARTCRAVTFTTATATSTSTATTATMYDCQGRAAAILAGRS